MKADVNALRLAEVALVIADPADTAEVSHEQEVIATSKTAIAQELDKLSDGIWTTQMNSAWTDYLSLDEQVLNYYKRQDFKQASNLLLGDGVKKIAPVRTALDNLVQNHDEEIGKTQALLSKDLKDTTIFLGLLILAATQATAQNVFNLKTLSDAINQLVAAVNKFKVE